MEVVPRVSGISRAEFRRQFLAANRPAIVIDGLTNSPSTEKWDLQFFKKRFGGLDVAVSGDFFSPSSVMKLSAFIELAHRLEETPPECRQVEKPTPYLRLAYPDFGGVDFTAIFFNSLQDEWRQPYFLPRRLYFSPLTLAGRPNRKRFPEWGLFISPRGGTTGIHIDRTNDNTILASTCGRKVGFLFEPTPPVLAFLMWEHRERERGKQSAALERTSIVLRGGQPDYPGLTAHYFELGPNEVLFIPKRWAHEVFTTSACVSLTYNFIHFCDVDRLYLIHRIFGIGFH